jgi:hypothetical protein
VTEFPTEALNVSGFYRLNISDFQATMNSDGYGPIPVEDAGGALHHQIEDWPFGKVTLAG